eukprot:4630475-Amphidinium_carterae.1
MARRDLKNLPRPRQCNSHTNIGKPPTVTRDTSQKQTGRNASLHLLTILQMLWELVGWVLGVQILVAIKDNLGGSSYWKGTDQLSFPSLASKPVHCRVKRYPIDKRRANLLSNCDQPTLPPF